MKAGRLCGKKVSWKGILRVASVDQGRTPDDQWYCVEVNPSPGFTYFQPQTNQAMAELLLWEPIPLGHCEDSTRNGMMASPPIAQEPILNRSERRQPMPVCFPL